MSRTIIKVIFANPPPLWNHLTFKIKFSFLGLNEMSRSTQKGHVFVPRPSCMCRWDLRGSIYTQKIAKNLMKCSDL